MRLTHLSLFSGIGGIDLAAEWAGFEMVCFVEIDKFCQKVLTKHWPDTPIIGDIRDVTKEKVMAFTTGSRSWSADRDALHEGRATSEGGREGLSQDPEGQVRVAVSDNQPAGFNGSAERSRTHSPITLITGGFPCQPVSIAGKRRGKEDDRWLWPEMLRVISEVRPTWVVAENVAGLIRMGLNDCLADLEGQGFEVQPFLIPACGVNAPHRRDRIFIVARNAKGNGGDKVRSLWEGEDTHARRVCEDVADTTASRLQRDRSELSRWRYNESAKQSNGNEWWAVEPDVGRVASGVSSRVDRLKSLGNAVVPQQIYPILRAIAEIENTEGGE
uniref:Putative methyltransferase n=1 Tax=viral metagenome TaxID=1070528 RepID=A0A6M3JZ01_9ZZZZ